jgi:hypothetical protein
MAKIMGWSTTKFVSSTISQNSLFFPQPMGFMLIEARSNKHYYVNFRFRGTLICRNSDPMISISYIYGDFRQNDFAHLIQLISSERAINA